MRDKHFEYIPAFVPKDAGGVQPLDPPACDVVRGNQAIDVLECLDASRRSFRP